MVSFELSLPVEMLRGGQLSFMRKHGLLQRHEPLVNMNSLTRNIPFTNESFQGFATWLIVVVFSNISLTLDGYKQ